MTKTIYFRSLLMIACCVFATSNIKAQFSFTNTNSLLPIPTHSGCSVTVVDVNNDGLDDILIMDQSQVLILVLHNLDGTFTRDSLTTVPGGGVWGMAAADVDHNGWKDVVTGAGYAVLVKLYPSGNNVIATTTILAQNYFVQNVLFGDFNNDGWADLEVNDDDDYAKIYQNTAGTLTPTTTLINTNINPGLTYGGDPYDSGNYGSVWTDFDNDGDLDLYICHCRQSASSNTDIRRRDRLFVNDGTNHYAEAGQAHGFEVTDFKQTWTTSFGDIDNDGDFDVVMTNHGENGQILQNNGAGQFTDITASTGFTTYTDPIESVLEDFDNDGYLDILISGGGNAGFNPWQVYHNNGNGTFTMLTAPFPPAANGMLSFGIGDLNHDGKVDVFASYGNVYNAPTAVDDVLYMNATTNANHFITFDLTGTVSNPDAIGAKVTIYGPWGIQEREVRAGESYGTANSMQLHFGLGSATTVDSARINWPSHMYTNHFYNLAADQFVSVIENTCSITGNILTGGPYMLCTGNTVTLTAASGFSSYLWSNNATTQSIQVSAAGSFSVKVSNSGGCSTISPTVSVQLNPDETPVIATSAADTILSCPGSITLTSSAASSYAWSGPGGFTATSQSITPVLPGNYTVSIVGTCGPFTSLPTSINFLTAPAPTTTPLSGPPGIFNLTATGSGGAINWYSAPSGGTSLFTGANYTTSFLNTTTTFYVDETTTHLGMSGNTGAMYHTGVSDYSPVTTNGVELFDVLNPCTIHSVKVYTDSAGTREIDLFNGAGVIMDSLSINLIADTTVVPLNWSLSAGTGYQLTTKASVNMAHWGIVSPILKRTATGVGYPINFSNLVSLTGTIPSVTGRYYYFYDWVVQGASSICESPRVPAVVTITTGINSYYLNNDIKIFPNPAADEVNLEFESSLNTSALVELTDITGRVVSKWTIDKPMQGQSVLLNVSSFSAGTYLLNITINNKKAVQKLVLTK